jgi:TonB family protein
MNPMMRNVLSFCAFLLLTYSSIGAEPVRVFYDVGPVAYEVSQFNKGLPVLDTPLEGTVERMQFDGKWSYSGELPLDRKVMSTVLPYRLRREPEVYSNRGQPPSYYVHLHSGFLNSLGWKTLRKSENLAVFGWLVGGDVKNVMVATPRSFSRFSGFLKMEGSGIDPSGILVVWSIDESGKLVPLDRFDSNPEGTLRLAAMNGELDELAKLTAENPKALNAKNGDGKTLLMYAALGGRTEVAKYLIVHGSKQFEVDDTGAAALDIAAESGWLEIVRLIASKKPKGSDQRLQYSVAAVNAYSARHQEISIHLLELEAKLKMDKKSAPEKALGLLASECVDLSRWVQEKYNVKGSFSDNGLNFIHAAAAYADTELLEALKADGASLTEKTDQGLTPLLIACGVGNREAICWLMENGGGVVESEGRDPIMYAISEGINESVSCLVDYGVDVNREEKEGVSPLMYACITGEKKIAETLLGAGAVWLFSSKYSDTSLRSLVRLNSPKLMKGLFKQGLSIEHKLFGLVGLYEIAEFYGADSLTQLLREGRSNTNSKLLSGKVVKTRPQIARRTELEYPFNLQEKYGDLDVVLKVGITDRGLVAAVQVDDETPKEVSNLVERSIMSWKFQPLDSGDDESLSVIKFKLPLRMSIREKDIFALNQVDDMPRAIYQVEPNYPYALKMMGKSGYVELEWIIDREGVVRFPKAIESSDKAFEDPAVEAIKQSRWAPAKVNGIPIAVKVKQRMDFKPQ